VLFPQVTTARRPCPSARIRDRPHRVAVPVAVRGAPHYATECLAIVPGRTSRTLRTLHRRASVVIRWRGRRDISPADGSAGPCPSRLAKVSADPSSSMAPVTCLEEAKPQADPSSPGARPIGRRVAHPGTAARLAAARGPRRRVARLVAYHREIAPGFGYAVGRWTPAWNVERTENQASPFSTASKPRACCPLLSGRDVALNVVALGRARAEDEDIHDGDEAIFFLGGEHVPGVLVDLEAGTGDGLGELRTCFRWVKAVSAPGGHQRRCRDRRQTRRRSKPASEASTAAHSSAVSTT
jgi:hypothetical protein